MVEDDLPAEEPPEQDGERLELLRGDAVDPVGVLHRGDAATQPQGEAAAGERLHRAREPGGDHGVPGVVVGRGGDDADPLGHGTGGPAENAGLLLVVPLADEGRVQAQRLGLAHLVDEVPGGLRLPGEQVAAEHYSTSRSRIAAQARSTIASIMSPPLSVCVVNAHPNVAMSNVCSWPAR